MLLHVFQSYQNAIEASPIGGRIIVKLSEEEFYTISIQNKGTIPREIRQTFFDKYVTFGKTDGTGLGTYSAKLIAETHAGSIDCETLKEESTKVSVQLPRLTIL